MTDPIRELLAFLVAKELRAICRCGTPATVESNSSCRAPVCDACADTMPEFDDWRDLKHAPAIRRLLFASEVKS